MKYLDTNVFVFALTPGPKEQAARRILHKVLTGSMDATTSCLTWDEFVWVLRKELDASAIIAESKKFLTFPHMTLLNVDTEVLELAQGLLERYSLKPRDALHAATAIKHGIHEIVSDDSDFDKVKEIKRIAL